MLFRYEIFKRPELILFFFLVFPGCNSNSNSINQGNSTSRHNDMQRNEQSKLDPNIIKGRLVSKSGEQLLYAFDNSSNTMIISFNEDTATLQRQLMGSGIKYSNKNYTYSESHGTSTLYKDSIKVFEAGRNN